MIPRPLFNARRMATLLSVAQDLDDGAIDLTALHRPELAEAATAAADALCAFAKLAEAAEQAAAGAAVARRSKHGRVPAMAAMRAILPAQQPPAGQMHAPQRTQELRSTRAATVEAW